MTISKTRIINIKKNSYLVADKETFSNNKAERSEIKKNNFTDFEFYIFAQGNTITSQINKEAIPDDNYKFSVKIVENEYYNCDDEEIIEGNYLCDLMIKSKYRLEWEDTDSPCDAENIYFLTLEDAIAEAMTQSV